MSHNDPDWEPRHPAGSVRRAEGENEVPAPEAADLDEDDPGLTVWIRGRVRKGPDGRWKRDIGRLEKRVCCMNCDHCIGMITTMEEFFLKNSVSFRR